MSYLKNFSLWAYLVSFLAIAISIFSVYQVLKGPQITYITDSVTTGSVRQIVSVSGEILPDNKAELSFPVTGTVEEIRVKEGDNVAIGDILITLERNDFFAKRQEALGNLAIASANKEELLSGPRPEDRDITAQNVAIAEAELLRISKEEDEKVKNLRRVLFSSNLEAFPEDHNRNNVAPTVSGTYTCENEGEYQLEMFASGAKSGYSYRLKGLESLVDTAYTDNPAPLGQCGLRILFPDGERFGNTDWIIPIPNKNSSSYSQNLSNYQNALISQKNKVDTARDNLELAKKEALSTNANPRPEEVRRANADIAKVQSALSIVDIEIDRRILRAPFSGIVSDINTKAGETVSNNPILTLVADEEVILTARVPEIDIGKLAVGQIAEVVFDAKSDTPLKAEITFISPIATIIDGVAYFETKLKFAEKKEWLRAGLNADVDIIVEEVRDTTKIPKRFLETIADKNYVLFREGEETIKKEVDVGLVGNDGYVEIFGLAPGTEILAP